MLRSSSQPDRNNTPIQATVEDIIVDTPKDLTALTAEDLAASILVHEARTRVTNWIMETENPVIPQRSRSHSYPRQQRHLPATHPRARRIF